MIAAIGKNNELGKNNNLIWHFKEDMNFFKEQTTGHKVIMGYKTYLSLPGLLKNRENILISKKPFVKEGLTVYTDKNNLINDLEKLNEEVFIIGGAHIYKDFISLADELILTEIEASDKDADAFFPVFNKKDYKCEILSTNNENNINYRHVRYIKK